MFMRAEIEVQFLNVDYDELRKKLRLAGARQKHPMQFMKRVIMDYPDQRLQHGVEHAWAFVRLRDEGDRVMLTYKEFAKAETLDGSEIEVEVSSYNKTIKIFEKVGLKVISEQHTRREAWQLDGVEITLDEWPWLPPVAEPEGSSAQALRLAADQLELAWERHMSGNPVNAYRKAYPGMTDDESIRDIRKLTFEEFPAWLAERQAKRHSGAQPQ